MAEKTTTVKVDDRGRVTIPKPIRETLDISEDDYVDISVRTED